MKKCLPYILYPAVPLVPFYLLPLFNADLGVYIIMLLFVFPALCIGSGILSGLRHGFNWVMALIIALLMLPGVFIFYNSTALVYVSAYALLFALTNVLCAFFARKKPRGGNT